MYVEYTPPFIVRCSLSLSLFMRGKEKEERLKFDARCIICIFHQSYMQSTYNRESLDIEQDRASSLHSNKQSQDSPVLSRAFLSYDRAKQASDRGGKRELDKESSGPFVPCQPMPSST
jgi:hypothetical protein